MRLRRILIAEKFLKKKLKKYQKLPYLAFLQNSPITRSKQIKRLCKIPKT
jgi:hypothetical protein